jgi:hypothetical protein
MIFISRKEATEFVEGPAGKGRLIATPANQALAVQWTAVGGTPPNLKR